MQLSRKHPGLVELKRGWFFISAPGDIQRVMAGPVHYTKGAFSRSVSRTMVDPLQEALGEGLLTSQGDLWRQQRKLAQPAFHKQRIGALVSPMIAAVQDLVDRWSGFARRGEAIDAVEEMRRVAMDTMGRTVFSIPLFSGTSELSAALIESVVTTNEQFWSLVPIPRWLPTAKNRRWKRLMTTINTGVHDMIEQRWRDPTDRGDILSAYMSSRNEQTGEGMSDQHLRDEVMTLLIAGHDSTAQSLCWALYLLARYPDAQAQLRAELDEVLAGRTPTTEDLPRLAYTTRVLHEAMRLYPPAWLLVRSPTEDDIIDDCLVPARSVVLSSPYATHRRPDLWEDPERFDPDRFTAERSAGRPKYAYFPFAGGGRQCIGNTFAMQEMQLVLAMVFQRYQLRLLPGHPVEVHAALTLRPRHGVRITLSERSAT